MKNNYRPSDVQREFLEKDYLMEKYHVPQKADKTAREVSEKLKSEYGNKFVGLCLVGGLTNGSHVVRTKEQERKREQERKPKSLWQNIFSSIFSPVLSDVDFYLLVDGAAERDLEGMADIVAEEFKRIGFRSDGVLNGKNPDNTFDVSRINEYVENGHYDLLSLPFKCIFGEKIEETKKAIISAVKSRTNARDIWEQIKFYHDSPLALHHRTFDTEFMDYVLNNWLPMKIEKFGLPAFESL
jgi:hypothetical protein